MRVGIRTQFMRVDIRGNFAFQGFSLSRLCSHHSLRLSGFMRWVYEATSPARDFRHLLPPLPELCQRNHSLHSKFMVVGIRCSFAFQEFSRLLSPGPELCQRTQSLEKFVRVNIRTFRDLVACSRRSLSWAALPFRLDNVLSIGSQKCIHEGHCLTRCKKVNSH